jgi:hypothetical protein
VKRAIRSKLMIGVALAALIAGTVVAVVASAQPAPRARHDPRAHAARSVGSARPRSRPLSAAAGYLGVTPSQLRGELRSGKSLAEIAADTPGKSQAGLIQALEAAQRAGLAAAAAQVPARVLAEVHRIGGARGAGGRRELLSAAASYLGTTSSELRSQLRSGKTLAQIASSTPGRSEAGLVAALVTTRKARLAAEVKSGAITQAREDALLPKLEGEISARIHRVRRARRPQPGALTG